MRWLLVTFLAACVLLQVAAAPELVNIMCWKCNKRTAVHERCQTELTCGHICNFIKSTDCDSEGCKHNIPNGHDHARPVKCATCGVRGNPSTASASGSSVSRSSSSRSSASSASGYSIKRYTGGGR
ncbi:hypothetical protein PGTUg99_029196 [Puccinia graminis f. sp. tritici]|uniref:Uncharacterized protein n=1 Tax=Puccinia graminis f. sp. tritici TaxID=56615 RepID=A0A5B0R9Y2_PUCGR|nr:hypothetical protein PGTUg99_029196 [Puccinia graminis f. sp. tritici]